MKSDRSILKHRGGFELARGGTVALVAIVALGIGAILPLGATLGVGAIAAWVGHYLDCHYARSDVSGWIVFGLPATVAAALGWIGRMVLDPRSGGPEDSAALSGLAVAVSIAALALRGWRELRPNRQQP